MTVIKVSYLKRIPEELRRRNKRKTTPTSANRRRRDFRSTREGPRTREALTGPGARCFCRLPTPGGNPGRNKQSKPRIIRRQKEQITALKRRVADLLTYIQARDALGNRATLQPWGYKFLWSDSKSDNYYATSATIAGEADGRVHAKLVIRWKQCVTREDLR